MILSMTGFGQVTLRNDGYAVTVELKSVNSKYIEIALKLPRGYFEQELALKNLLTAKLQRGKVSASVSVTQLHAAAEAPLSVGLDTQLLKAYHAQLEAVSGELGLSSGVSMDALLALPGVVQEAERTVSEDEWELVQKAVEQAADALTRSRATEGQTLAKDLVLRCDALDSLLTQVKPLEAERIGQVRQRLQNALNELQQTTGAQANADRFEQEIIFYLEKNDITEEQVRLAAHIALFRTTLNEKESQGRKLGFIAQEMGREINTLGAKAYHAGMQQVVVQMKDELEKIKEQLNNIL